MYDVASPDGSGYDLAVWLRSATQLVPHRRLLTTDPNTSLPHASSRGMMRSAVSSWDDDGQCGAPFGASMSAGYESILSPQAERMQKGRRAKESNDRPEYKHELELKR
ncbi:hypothetical protein R3P38DRAFT_2796219 [Favolaschia claudopus]|uniref:Uncharacterized protein n=1 Tax=Favolaschia claudopus TaxID=2862362 RepID=A0AAW0A584_9AGAR